ncbi:hypothetical protein A7E78_02335 [Syntrophotalea acetylenivorans]|uniref:PilZ domain-containing protein n=1 Tax=Syntrophotalea acetylenivorans TaxID=1842532 RepID=A0A1L3GLH7_9BACT|nr:hypothetical protein [Syntrophotalea acetylenivorans]APG26793.1 hypothetical protein A7E78_02335 [Syntrophotalea acetylenivorans]
MTEKRLSLRKNRRLELRFGPDEPKRIGFTCDITRQGFFIQSSSVCRPGTLLIVVMVMANNQEVRLEARVQWAKRVPPNLLRRVKKGGMGVKIIRFCAGEAIYHSYCAALNA